MKWAFLGAGALGVYFGGRLQQAGVPVQYLVRPARKALLQKTGLIIRSPLGDYHGPCDLTTDPSALSDADVVVLAVKSPHLAGALASLDAIPNVPILPVLNGIEHMTVLQKRYPGRVLGGVVHIEATLDPEGAVIHGNPMARFTLGALDPAHQKLAENLGADLMRSHVETKISQDIRLDLWQKYFLIDMMSGLTTATGLAVGPIRTVPATMAVAERMADEFLQVAQAEGTSLGTQAWTIFMRQLEAFSPTMTSSMARDKEKGLVLETDHIQGAIIRLGETHHIATPVHSTLYGILAPFILGQPT